MDSIYSLAKYKLPYHRVVLTSCLNSGHTSLSRLEQTVLLGLQRTSCFPTVLFNFIPPKKYSKEKKIKKTETSEDILMCFREGVLAGSWVAAFSRGMNPENYRSLEVLNFVEDSEQISGLKFCTRSPETSPVLAPLFITLPNLACSKHTSLWVSWQSSVPTLKKQGQICQPKLVHNDPSNELCELYSPISYQYQLWDHNRV